MTIPAYPLQWPEGWKRTKSHQRTTARFSTKSRGSGAQQLTIADGAGRVRTELERMGISDNDLVVSTNVKPRLDGFPRSDQRAPDDPGAAVYWKSKGATRCMAIDLYNSVAGNLGAIAATLEAMRAIERHGGAEVLDRAFTGFAALPAPDSSEDFRVVLGLDASSNIEDARNAYRRLASLHHPDKGGDAGYFGRVVRAWERAQRELA